MSARYSMAIAALAIPASLASQVRPIRSVDYLPTAGVSDVRSTWVNPAGLSAIPEASVILEFTGGRNASDDFALEQYAVGFNSRGLSITYLRNRFGQGNPSTAQFRVATGLPIERGAFGFAVTLYGAPGENDRDLDVGFQYALTPILTTAGVVRHIGRPTIGTQTLPIDVTGGALLSLGGGRFRLSADAIATETLGGGLKDFTMGYRGGGVLMLPFRRPVQVLATADLGSNLRINRIHVGIGIGGRSQVLGIGTMVSRGGTPTLDRLSLAGVTSNLLVAR